MKTIRIIPCLDCKYINGKARVVKGTKFKKLQTIGNPIQLARKYYRQGADEICFLDITASKESRKSMREVIARVSEQVFVPLTVGGGIRTLEDARKMFRAGADKVSINTAALQRPKLIQEISKEFGNQACVVAMDAKKQKRQWNVYAYGGTKNANTNALKWAQQAEQLGAGELLVTSMDCDGTRQGYDVELLKTISESVNIPVIASGGAGNLQDIAKAIVNGKADAVLAASIFHYKKYSVREVKKYLQKKGISVRI